MNDSEAARAVLAEVVPLGEPKRARELAEAVKRHVAGTMVCPHCEGTGRVARGGDSR